MITTPREVSRQTPVVRWPDRLLIGYFTVAGVAVLVIWAGYFLDGTAAPPFRPAEETVTLLGRTAGALLAGLVVSAAAVGTWTRRNSARGVGVFGAGMVGYAALNTLGETLAAGSFATALLLVVLPACVAVGRMSRESPAGVGLLGALAVFTIWLLGRVSGGALTEATTVVAWPGPHYLAEAVMAIVTVTGLFARARGRSWGGRLALGGLGTYCYSTLSALDWAVVNDPALIPILAATLVAAVLGAIHLVMKEET